MQNNEFEQAQAWCNTLGGGVFNWRFIHDRDKATPAIKRRGTLEQVWNEACQWNAAGYGIFATVSEMDGTGYDAAGRPIQGVSGDTGEHVAAVRAHVVDLDNLAAMNNLQRAMLHVPAPWFAVQTSPGKAHVYWPLHGDQRYRNNDTFRILQRKLRQLYDGDKAVVDATRVLRVPGFYHQKGQPHLVTCWSLSGYGQPIARELLALSVAHINAVDDGGGRHPLGDAELAAPSVDWLWYALETMPVDGMSHPDFISFTAAFKQAGWNIADHGELRDRWLKWCERFGASSKGTDYNLKHWDSIQDTEVGWKSLLRQNVSLNGAYQFYGSQHQPTAPQAQVSPLPDMTQHQHQPSGGGGELMMAEDYAQYFKHCTFITRLGVIMDPKGQLLGPTQFNGAYGGPRFIIAPNNTAPTDEPWKAATRSFFWTVPKVDYMRFIPHEPPMAIITDELGRTGVNTFRPAIIKRVAGDPKPFFHHLELLIPDEGDRAILLDYIAHNAQYPGFKIPWAPLIQSAEGAGKGVFKSLFSHLVGNAYFHSPNAKELTEGGSKFNGWMRNKLFILVDEIKTDERRDMIEVLKPWISEKEIEIQSKGMDQDKEDNYSNWAFFSNYKDAVPINQNSRRFAIFYSPIQSVDDLIARKMDDNYFTWLYNWFDHQDGAAIMAHYFMYDYKIDRGNIPMRAPKTSSHGEAVKQGRTVTERALLDAIEMELPGFKGGWISTLAAAAHLRDASIRVASAGGLERIIEGLGYHSLGRAPRPYFQESNVIRPILFNVDRAANVEHYANAQGYGSI